MVSVSVCIDACEVDDDENDDDDDGGGDDDDDDDENDELYLFRSFVSWC